MALFEFDLQKKYERMKEEQRLRAKGIVEDKKRIVQVIKLYAPAGAAVSGPPLSPILGQHQLNVADFCRDFNKITATMDNRLVVPVLLHKKADKTFDLTLRPVFTTFYFGAYRQLRTKYVDRPCYFFPLSRLRHTVLLKALSRRQTGFVRGDDQQQLFEATKTVLGTAKSAKLSILRRRR
jgi:ribosomal protein L11